MDPKSIPWRGQISINQVLADIRAEPMKAFWLAFVRATGEGIGSVKVSSSTLYGAPRIDGRTNDYKASTRIKASALHTEKGTLPCTDKTKGEYLTPLISHIIGYNMYQVKH
ncbi:MAG TPA: hypothetical protein PK228_01410 [Saprospiraceae bacterium]|nr:hypothetical protein [Saprospiraceae bacterium]